MNSASSNTLKKKSVQRLSKGDFLSLLNKDKIEIVNLVSKTNYGFAVYLEKQRYTADEDKDQIIELILEILSRVFSITRKDNFASVSRLVRMLQDCDQFFFIDVPRLVHSCFTEKQSIDLVLFMFNYMNILKTFLHKNLFFEKIRNIFPALENYMNRLREQRLSNLSNVEECFKKFKWEIGRWEDPDTSENEVPFVDVAIKSFRELPVVPRSSDIVNCERNNIPQNIIDRPYESVDHFLSVYYRLTREDMLGAFRASVKLYLEKKGGFQRNSEIGNLNYFENVSVSYPPIYSASGIHYEIKGTSSKLVDWSNKVLIPGTLVFLTPDCCNTVIFATTQENPRVDNNKSRECRIKIRLEDDTYNDELLKDACYEMIVPGAYFECYKYVLSSIKDFSESTFPLADIIVYFDYSDPEPQYLHENRQYCLHEKCDDSGEECSCKVFNPLKDDEWPTSGDLDLDDQQYDAFKKALTKKVVVIQGPPGTGKTFIGVKVVKSLIKNIPLKPVVVCCLTNHALDEFLKRMLSITQKIVRVGGQSKMEELEAYTLNSMMLAISQHKNGSVDSSLAKSLNIVRKISPDVLSQNIPDLQEPEFYKVMRLANHINRNLKLYILLEEKYLDVSALNKIINIKYKNQLLKKAGTIVKSLDTCILEWLGCSRSSDLYDKCTKMFYKLKQKNVITSFDCENIWTLTEKVRYEFFYCWRKECMDIVKRNLETLIEEYKTAMQNADFKKIEPIRQELLSKADIVGVTTTGAGKYKDLLKYVKPSIILIEEAAQVLESHVITSLFPYTQHLILIGDHEQLRPLPADNELSEKYNLKISMFERLFLNNAPSATLVMQHRMKPCIAELLVPRPYAEYKSYKNVYLYEEIRGVKSSVFFFKHQKHEDQNSSGTSSKNDFEAQMIVALAKFFIFNQYSCSDITILATYGAQVLLIKEYLAQQNLIEIHTTTVDNYQGEENEIILLSFVRSNEPGIGLTKTGIGFLKESNRVCVALSRAKKGMFCFGNFELFAAKNDLWNQIVNKLHENNMIGDTLNLKCFRHGTIQPVKNASDILDFLSCGCSEKCNFELLCKHLCSRNCHFEDPDHKYYMCKQPCEKMIDETRVCPRLCYEKCKKGKKKFIELPCGHKSSKIDSLCVEEEQKWLPCNHLVTVPCHVDVEQYLCKAKVNVNLTCGHQKSIWCYEQKQNKKIICTDKRPQIGPCGHTIEIPCNLNLDEYDLLPICNKACDTLLDCGHPCVRPCSSCFDTSIHGFCSEKCELVLTCGHKCGGYCGSPCPPCNKKCFLSCAHGIFCSNVCLRSCVKSCENPCDRKCSHQKCSKKCYEDCSIDPCFEPCQEILPCGHMCIGLCGDPCPVLCRNCDPSALKSTDNGKFLYVELECEHVIELGDLNEHVNVCLMSLEWPCCPQCYVPITRNTRYKEKLMQAKRICIESSDISEENAMLFYLVECMYGIDFIVPAQFKTIHKEIVRILKKDDLQADALMVLKQCVMMLKKLVNIAPELKNCDEYVQGKFDSLILWIYNHLKQASFQQLRELESVVAKLTLLID